MSDETIQDPLSPESPGETSPTTSTQEAPQNSPESTPNQPNQANQPTVDLDSTVKVGGETYTISDLIERAHRGAAAEEYSNYASLLMHPNTTDEQREVSIRYLMNKEGYAPEQIEEYVSNLKGEGTMPDNAGNPENSQKGSNDDAAFLEYQKSVESRIRGIEEKQSKVGIDFLRTQLKDSVADAMDSNSSIKTLLEKSKQLNGDEGFEDRKSSIRSQLESQIIENLRSRKSKGENFDVGWFNDAANKAADTIYDRIRSVIGDPDKIGRSPETASETEMLFSNRKPVEAPAYEKDDTVGSLDSKIRDYNTDALSRLAVDLNSGDETKA